MLPSVKQELKALLLESMLVAFPLKYSKHAAKIDKQFLHVSQARGVPQKKCEYFSTSGELIFTGNVKRDEDSGSYEKGYYGLPTGREVATDLMI
jgi:hypothetical protein